MPFQHAPTSGCWPPISSRTVGVLHLKNCYIFDSCLRRCGKGQRHKSHSKALRNQIAEVFKPCSFPPSPPTPLHPRRGDQGSSTTLCGQRFVWGGVHVRTPTFKPAGNRVSLWPHDAACVRFEGWRLTVNSSTFNTRPHRAVGPPLPPGGAREGWGESGGCSARMATQSIAACAVPARARGLKAIQRPCGNRLQKLQRLVHSPPLPQPLSTPAGGMR